MLIPCKRESPVYQAIIKAETIRVFDEQARHILIIFVNIKGVKTDAR